MRAQMQRLKAITGAVSAVVFSVVGVKSGQFGVTAAVTGVNGTADVADDNGRVKVYRAADDFITVAFKDKVLLAADTVAYSFANGAALEPKPFAGDIVKRTTSERDSLVKQKVASQAVSANLATVISLLPADTTAEIAYKAEKQAQKDCVDALITWQTSEIARLNALLGG